MPNPDLGMPCSEDQHLCMFATVPGHENAKDSQWSGQVEMLSHMNTVQQEGCEGIVQ